MTPEQRQKISDSLKGRKLSEEHKSRLRASHLGRKLSTEHRHKLSAAHRGVPLSEAHRKSISAASRGTTRNVSMETRASAATRMRTMNLGKIGNGHPRWISDRTTLARVSQQRTKADVTWSSHVRRMFPVCILGDGSYGECSGRLESHHIEPISKCPEQRFDIGNGVTLCRGHHPLKQEDVEKLKPVLRALIER